LLIGFKGQQAGTGASRQRLVVVNSTAPRQWQESRKLENSVRRLILLLVLIANAACMALPEDLPPDVLKIARAVTANRELVKHVASFTCLETIRRVDFARNQRKIKTQDIVQVEVGVGGGQEVFSWPGQNNFSDSGLGQIVGHGMVATGLFQSIANTVFASNAAMIKLIDENTLHAQAAYHFSYKIPSLQSRWEVDWLGARANVGEEGEFWVDPLHFTLLTLTANAVDVPPNLPIEHLRITIRYRPESIGIRKTLLPESADILATEWNGSLHHDEVSFSHCRVFGAESTLLLSAADLAKEVSQFQRNREILPSGLTLSLTLETLIDSVNAMIGDKIRATLERPVLLPDKSTIPKGAVAEGYVREFEKLDQGGPYYQIGLEFDRIRWHDHSADFFAEALSLDRMVSLDHATHTEHKQNWGANQAIQYSTETFYPVQIPGVANFTLEGSHVQVPKGFRMIWKTQEPASSRNPTR
jgi:hypothetical protein